MALAEELCGMNAYIALPRSQPQKPVSNLRVLVAEFCFIALAGLTDPECPATLAYVKCVLNQCLLRDLVPQRWPYHFLSRASLQTSEIKDSSAYILSRRRFWSSCTFIRFIKDASIPPYSLAICTMSRYS
jgi:hypothetical protein